MAMGTSLSLVVSNIFVKYFDNFNLDPPTTNLPYGSDMWMTLVIWTYGHEKLQEFCQHFSSLRPSTQYTMGKESGCSGPECFGLWQWNNPRTKSSLEATYWLLFAFCNHPYHINRGGARRNLIL
jgi:hypothetical protein